MRSIDNLDFPEGFPLVSQEARELGFALIEKMRGVPLQGVSGALFLDALFFATFLQVMMQSGGSSHVLTNGFGALFAQASEYPEFLERLRVLLHTKSN